MAAFQFFASASLFATLGACDSSVPVEHPPAAADEALLTSMEVRRSSVHTITLPYPAGERPPPSDDERETVQRALFQDDIERRIADRAGDAQALALAEQADQARWTETVATANTALREMVPRIQACPNAPDFDRECNKPIDVAILVDTFGLFDAWLLVDEHTEVPESFLACAGRIVWERDWPSSGSLYRFSASLHTEAAAP